MRAPGAHRLETVLAADRIIVLENGKIAADLRGEGGRGRLREMAAAALE